VLDLTASNPTTIGLHYREDELLQALAHGKALTYEPQAKGCWCREAVSAYYAAHGSHVSPDDLILTTSTSEAYSFLFRLAMRSGRHGAGPDPSTRFSIFSPISTT